MELKQLISHFTYRIEPKPGGGFIAHSSDPTVTPLEAPTREELQQKIQENIRASLSAQFPGLKLPADNQNAQFSFHIEHKPGGGLSIHSSDPNAEPIDVLTHNDMESRFAEKMIGLVGKHLTPELSQALAQGKTGEIKVVVNRQTGLSVNTGSHKFSVGLARNQNSPTSVASSTSNGATAIDVATPKPNGVVLERSGGAISSNPIIPETRSGSKIFQLLLLVLAAVVLGYFFTHHH